MIGRRQFLTVSSMSAIAAALPALVAQARAAKILFVHGRAQQGRDPVQLKADWMAALVRGFQGHPAALAGIDVALPFYGDVLDAITRESQVRVASDIHERGSGAEDEYLAFQADIAEAMRSAAGVSESDIDREYGTNPRPRGPLNWEWVQAILRAVDTKGGGLSASGIERFTRDVFLYCTRTSVRERVDGLVRADLTDAPTIVVGHSLGSVVAYSVLRSDTRRLNVPLFVTIGSPLGIRAVREQLRPLVYPPVDAWYNAYDTRDVVALYPLDSANFPVTPAVTNYSEVRNHTDNRHGIDGYLDDQRVASWIGGGLSVA